MEMRLAASESRYATVSVISSPRTTRPRGIQCGRLVLGLCCQIGALLGQMGVVALGATNAAECGLVDITLAGRDPTPGAGPRIGSQNGRLGGASLV